jgi:cytochrome b561
MVTKVDEQDAAMISHAMNPTGKADSRADVGLAKSGTGVAAVTMHFVILKHAAALLPHDQIWPEKRMARPICQGKAQECRVLVCPSSRHPTKTVER